MKRVTNLAGYGATMKCARLASIYRQIRLEDSPFNIIIRFLRVIEDLAHQRQDT